MSGARRGKANRATLTTIPQPCREIGQIAMAAMLDRIQHPNMIARDILLNCKLVVRASCGGA